VRRLPRIWGLIATVGSICLASRRGTARLDGLDPS